jgi:hypothetical protein
MGMSPPARRIARSGGEPTTKIASHVDDAISLRDLAVQWQLGRS